MCSSDLFTASQLNNQQNHSNPNKEIHQEKTEKLKKKKNPETGPVARLGSPVTQAAQAQARGLGRRS